MNFKDTPYPAQLAQPRRLERPWRCEDDIRYDLAQQLKHMYETWPEWVKRAGRF